MKILSWGPLLLLQTNLISVWKCSVQVFSLRVFSHACLRPVVHFLGFVGDFRRVWQDPYCPAEEPSVRLSGFRRYMASLTTSSSSRTVCRIKAFVSLIGRFIVRSKICVLRVTAVLNSPLPRFASLSAEITSKHNDLLPLKSLHRYKVLIILRIWFDSKNLDALMGMLNSQY